MRSLKFVIISTSPSINICACIYVVYSIARIVDRKILVYVYIFVHINQGRLKKHTIYILIHTRYTCIYSMFYNKNAYKYTYINTCTHTYIHVRP